MDSAKLKKYGPVAFGAAVIIGGIYYLRRNGTIAASPMAYNTGYSVVNPPDNSQSVAAAVSMQQSRMEFAGMGLSALTALESKRMDNEAAVNVASLQFQHDLDALSLNNARDITLAGLASDLEKTTQANQLEGMRITGNYQLEALKDQNRSAIEIQKEQNRAAISLQEQSTQVQNNAIRAQQSVAKHQANTQLIGTVLGIVAMIAFCYDATETAYVNRRVYQHGGDRHQIPGGDNRQLDRRVYGPAFRDHRGMSAQHHSKRVWIN